MAITLRAPARPRSARSRSGKSAMGSAPSRISVSTLPSAAARRMPAASRPRAAGTPGQRSAEPVGPGVERDVAREQAGRHAQLERPVDVGPAQAGEEPHLGPGLGDDRGGGGQRVARLGQVGPADHDRHRPVGQQRTGRPHGGGLDVGHRVADVAGQQRLDHGDQAAGPVVERLVGDQAVVPLPTDASSTTLTPVVLDTAWRSRRYRTGSSSLRSAPMQHDRAAGARRRRRSWPGAGRARPPPAGRRPSGRRRCRSRARP